jgi:hypothetical protein
MWVTHEGGGKKSGIYGLLSYRRVNRNANQQKLFALSARNELKITKTARNSLIAWSRILFLRFDVFTEPSIHDFVVGHAR